MKKSEFLVKLEDAATEAKVNSTEGFAISGREAALAASARGLFFLGGHYHHSENPVAQAVSLLAADLRKGRMLSVDTLIAIEKGWEYNEEAFAKGEKPAPIA